MSHRKTLSRSIANPKNKRQVISHSQTASEIATQLRRAEYNSRQMSKRLAPYFNEKDKKKVCQKIWKFLRQEIEYRKEPESDQTAKEINVFLRQGYGDCKHFATMCVGVLNACGIPAWFVLVGQSKWKRTPNHAYCQARVNGKVITIDPVKKVFNKEVRYDHKWKVSRVKK